ncbi:MAG: endonuclease, partial [Balneolales bacterium]|nr:endonuclease [Balneolales bacterium]
MKSLFYRLLAIPGLALLLSVPSVAQAQIDHEILWPGLEGQELLDSVRVNFKPLVNLNYNNARDEMYSYVDNHDGLIQCIYTGQTAAINPNTTTPRADAGNANFNAEHIYPQSMGASSGNANSDLHHLQPSNANVNSSRGNLPFGYVPSASTNRWWSGTTTQTTMPAGDLTIWSLTGSSNFQPKDDSQGNVARAMYYFYSIYTNEALAANAIYFDMQREALLNFHRADPVDEREWTRTHRAAEFQEGLVNPFVLDTSLVARIYFVGQTIDPPPGDDDGGDGGDDDNGDDNGDSDGAPIASFTFSNTFDCNNQDNA